MATMFGPDGKTYEVPDDKVDAAVAAGMRLPQPSEANRIAAGDMPVRAGVESAARGATLGISDALLPSLYSGLSGRPVEEFGPGIGLRREENPIIATGGEVGGVIASMAIPGAPALKAAQAGKAAGALAGGGIKGAVAAGAVEGGLWGVGSALTEATIENRPLTAERVAASAAAGGLTGGALTGGFSVLGKGVSAGVQKLGGALTPDALRSASVTMIKAQLSSMKMLKRHGKFFDEIVEFGFDEGVLHPGTTYQTGAAAAKAVKDRISVDYSTVLDAMDAAVKPATAKGANLATHGQDVLDKVRTALKQYDNQPTMEGEVGKIVDQLEDLVNRGNVTWRDLWKHEENLRKMLVKGAAPEGTKEVVSSARRALRDAIFEQSDQVLGQPWQSKFRDINKNYARASALDDMFTEQLLKAEARGTGIKELIPAGLVGAMGGGPLGAIATGVAGKLARERGGFVLGGVLDKMRRGGGLSKMAQGFHAQVAPKLAVTGDILGKFHYPIATAAARGAEDLMATHIALAQSAEGSDYMARMGLTPEAPDEVEAVGGRMAYIQAAEEMNARFDAATDKAVDGFFGAKRGPTPRGRGALTREEFDSRMKGIEQLVASPERAYENVPAGISGALPATSAEAVNATIMAAQFLQSKAPKDPSAGIPEALRRAWEPSAAELAKWGRYVEAVDSPLKVIEQMKSGNVVVEHVETLQTVYPAIYADLQARMAERLAQWDKPLPYAKRAALGALLGPRAVGMEPSQMALIQQIHGTVKQPTGGPGGPDGRQGVDAEKNMQTQAQRLEGR